MTMTFTHKVAAAALVATAAVGAQAATESYTEDFSSLFYDNKGGKEQSYNNSNVLANYNGSLFSGEWVEAGTVEVSAGSDVNVQFDGGDGLTFSFTLASSPSVTSYDLSVEFYLGGYSKGDQALVSTTLDNSSTTVWTPPLSIDNPSYLRSYAFTGITAGTYSFSVAAGSGAWVSMDNFTIAATSVSAVPEPEGYALMLAGLAALGATALRKRALR